MVIKSNSILKNLPHHPHQNKDFMDSNGYKDAATPRPLCVPTMEGLAVTTAHLKLRSLDWWVEVAMPVRIMDISNELMKNGNVFQNTLKGQCSATVVNKS